MSSRKSTRPKKLKPLRRERQLVAWSQMKRMKKLRKHVPLESFSLNIRLFTLSQLILEMPGKATRELRKDSK